MRRLAPLLALALAIFPAGACSSQGGPDAGAGTAEALGPVAAPAGLLADVVVPTPSATWAKARAAVGGPAIFLPQSFGGLCAQMMGLPITLAPEIDEAVPVVGAVARQGKGPIGFTVGVHVKSGERLVGQVTRGEGARFNATVDQPTRITLLTDKVSPESARFAIGVLGNYLLVAEKPADLLALGPYVARTLPTRPAPQEEVVVDLSEPSLSGPVLDAVKEYRTHAQGAAAALVPVGGMLDSLTGLLADAQRARVTLALEPQVVHARATITPKAGGGPGQKLVAELAVGDAKPLLALPDGTTLGLLWRESPASRNESAPRQAEALANLLGKDVTADDRGAIGAALRAEAEARGDWQAVGIAFNGTGPTAVVRAPANDADKMAKALKQLVDLAALPTFKKALADLGLRLSAEKAVVENLAGEVTRVRLARADADAKDGAKGKAEKGKGKEPKGEPKAAEPPDPSLPKAIDLLYLVNGEGLFAAAGFDPKDSLKSLARAPSGASLAQVAPMAAALSGVGADASFVLIADALRMEAMTAGLAAPATPTPLVLAAGRTAAPAELWARLDLPMALVQRALTEYTRRRAAPKAEPKVEPKPEPKP